MGKSSAPGSSSVELLPALRYTLHKKNLPSCVDEEIREDTGLHQGKDNVWHPDYIDVVPNYVYIIRLYVHNNNPNGLQAVAKDVKAAFQIPTESGSQIRVTGIH